MPKRPKFDPLDHGLNMTLPQFREFVASLFDTTMSSARWTIDELLLRPVESYAFCDRVRSALRKEHLEDHDILRALLNHRRASKNKSSK